MENKPDGVTTKINLDGSLNSKYVDLLDEDKPVAGQRFACVSFLSPEKIIKEKNLFYFNEFLKQWEMSKSLEKYTDEYLDVALKLSIHFFEQQEEYEKCILLKSILDKIEEIKE